MKKVVSYCRNVFFLFYFSLVCLFIVFTESKDGFAICVQNLKGGECVEYVRDYFGGSLQSMPGLCQYNYDCGAYNAWRYWDLGFRKGEIPADNSIMVIGQFTGLSTGHMAAVISANSNLDGTYTLNVYESNWDLDKLVDCDVEYTFYPEDSEATRKSGTKRYPVLGFIYGSPFPTEAAPIITLSLNQSNFAPNDTLTLYLNIHNPGPTIAVDYYFSLTFPNGFQYYAIPNKWSASPAPLGTSFTISQGYNLSNYKYFTWTLPNNWQRGEYTFKMWLTVPGTSQVIGKTAEASFEVGSDKDQQAKDDMVRESRNDFRFGNYIPGTFGKNLDTWSLEWELRWMDFDFYEGRVVRIYHATKKSDSSIRYTIFWDPDVHNWTDWIKVK